MSGYRWERVGDSQWQETYTRLLEGMSCTEFKRTLAYQWSRCTNARVYEDRILVRIAANESI